MERVKDQTYCMCDCVFTRCDRHKKQIPDKPENLSWAYLFNTEYCPMKIRRRDESKDVS